MFGMRVLVCGGRDYDDYARVDQVLSMQMLSRDPITELCTGAARGADSLADTWGRAHGTDVVVWSYPADWKRHGKAAGPIRNQKMLDEFKPELVVAFPGGKGTANMMLLSRIAGVKVIEVYDDPDAGTYRIEEEP